MNVSPSVTPGEGNTFATASASEVRVQVPATSANVGPGFDCLGIALRVYNTVIVRRGPATGPDTMANEAAEAFFRRSGKEAFAFQWEICGDVPRSRGLGSSVTVRLGLLHGLNALAGSPLKPQEVFEICAELEGHPDNAAPAAFGGFTIARMGVPMQRYPVDPRVSFVLLIPDFEVATPDARKVLPASIPLKDAILSASNASAVAGAFASGDYEKLAGCFEDRLHQPYREKLVPCLSAVIAAGREAGALGGWLSGSGSTIACMTLEHADQVAQAMLAASGIPGAKTLVTRADNDGVQIDVSP